MLVVTKGFRDALAIGHQARPRIFERQFLKPDMLSRPWIPLPPAPSLPSASKMFGQELPDVFQRSEVEQVVVSAALEFHVFFRLFRGVEQRMR
jgi:hypothetical protein